jgi:hypothetical protein
MDPAQLEALPSPQLSFNFKLFVGDCKFITTYDVITRCPYLEQQVWDPLTQLTSDGYLCIPNLNGEIFKFILEYLHTGIRPLFWNERLGFDLNMFASVYTQAQMMGLLDLARWISEGGYNFAVRHERIRENVWVSQGDTCRPWDCEGQRIISKQTIRRRLRKDTCPPRQHEHKGPKGIYIVSGEDRDDCFRISEDTVYVLEKRVTRVRFENLVDQNWRDRYLI